MSIQEDQKVEIWPKQTMGNHRQDWRDEMVVSFIGFQAETKEGGFEQKFT